MKTVNKKTETSKVNLETRNAQNEAFNKFVEQQAKKAAEMEAAKIEAREMRKTRSEHFSLKNNVLLLIYNAGNKGILISEIMESKPLNHSKTAFNIHTINRDFNVKSPIQAEQTRLNEAGVMVAFEVEQTETTPEQSKVMGNTKHNNRITLPEFCKETLKTYLLSKNAKPEYFTENK